MSNKCKKGILSKTFIQEVLIHKTIAKCFTSQISAKKGIILSKILIQEALMIKVLKMPNARIHMHFSWLTLKSMVRRFFFLSMLIIFSSKKNNLGSSITLL